MAMHCVKSACNCSFFGLCFLAFGLNMNRKFEVRENSIVIVVKGNIYLKIVRLKIKNVSFAKRRDTLKVCKAKKKNSSVQRKANLIQEAESNEDELFNAYHQRVIG